MKAADSSKTMVTNYHIPDDLNLHILLSSTYILPSFFPFPTPSHSLSCCCFY